MTSSSSSTIEPSSRIHNQDASSSNSIADSSNTNNNTVKGHHGHHHDQQHQQQEPSASFSTLWLPFKSPFRRPFFFAGNNTTKSTTSNHDHDHTSFHSLMDEGGHDQNHHQNFVDLTQNSQHLPWLQQFALHQQEQQQQLQQQQLQQLQQQQQKEQQQPLSMACLKQGDIPIFSTSSNGSNGAFLSSSFGGDSGSISDNDSTVVFQDDAVVADIVDKCCGIVPPLFQTAVVQSSGNNGRSSEQLSFPTPESISIRALAENTNTSHSEKKHSSSSSSSTVERNGKKTTVNGSKKKGFIPMRLNRRGRNDASLSTKDHHHQRHQELQRVTHKKQRAAHQASSPSSYGSLSRPGSMDRSKGRDRDASPPPSLRCINGLRVTMIDEELKVFVVDLLTPETCDLVRRMADEHVKEVQKNGNNIATWRTLYTYTKKDLPCSEVKGLTSRVTDHIMSNIIDVVGEIYGKKQEATKLHPRSWKEPHLLLYRKFENEAPHTGVEMHYDGCDITWNCMLSKSTEYDGGGTYVRALRKTVRLQQGQVLVHPGELYHKGCDITRGERALIVCFMDGFDPHIVDPSSAQEDNEVYEKNVRTY